MPVFRSGALRGSIPVALLVQDVRKCNTRLRRWFGRIAASMVAALLAMLLQSGPAMAEQVTDSKAASFLSVKGYYSRARDAQPCFTPEELYMEEWNVCRRKLKEGESTEKCGLELKPVKGSTAKEHLTANGDRGIILVLGGTGATMLGHIGVLEVLEEYGIKPDLIIGSSGGALVGGLWAAGYRATVQDGNSDITYNYENTCSLEHRDTLRCLVQTENWDELLSDEPTNSLKPARRKTRQDNILTRQTLRVTDEGRIDWGGLVEGQNVLLALNRIFVKESSVNTDFDKLHIPFRAVATDLHSGKPVCLGKRNLAHAVRSSFAIPVFFAPFEFRWNSKHDIPYTLHLADGGLVKNLAVDVAVKEGESRWGNGNFRIIAVDVKESTENQEAEEERYDILGSAERVVSIAIDREVARQKTLLKDLQETARGSGSNHLLIEPKVAYRSFDFAKLKDADLTRKILNGIHNRLTGTEYDESSSDKPASGKPAKDTLVIARLKEIKAFRNGASLSRTEPDDTAGAPDRERGGQGNLQCSTVTPEDKHKRSKYINYSEIVVSDVLIGTRRQRTPENGSNESAIPGKRIKRYLNLREPEEDEATVQLSIEKLKRKLASLYSLGDFERVGYRLEPIDEEPSKCRLVIEATERESKNALRFGFSLDNDLDNREAFTAAARYTRLGITSGGAYLDVDLSAGEVTSAQVAYYQPLDWGDRYFARAVVLGRDYVTYFFDDRGERLAEYDSQELEGGVDIGRNFGSWGEFQLGARRGAGRFRRSIGDLVRPENKFDIAKFIVEMRHDQIDANLDWPTAGTFASATWTHGLDFLGGSIQYDTLDIKLMAAYSFNLSTKEKESSHLGRGPNTVQARARLGFSLGDERAPLFPFVLGGRNNLSGFATGEISGDEMAYVGASYYRRLRLLLEQPIYAGFSIEAGQVWQFPDEHDFGDLILGGSAFVGADTFFGPVCIGIGVAEGGRELLYFSWGKSF